MSSLKISFIGRLAKIFEVDTKEIEFVLGGINHFPWILDLKVRGKDGFSLLRDWLKEHGAMFYAKDKLDNSTESVFMDRMALKFTIFEEFGYLPASGDRHIAEYFPYFLTEKTEWGLKYGVELTTYQHRVDIRQELKKLVVEKINQREPLKLEHSEEQLSRIISSYVRGKAGRYIINYPNKGQIANLPRDVVVECQALIGERGIEPLCIGDLPLVIHQIVMSHILKQEIMVEAAIKRNKKIALRALLVDPQTRNWKEAKIMLDEMLQRNKKYIPELL